MTGSDAETIQQANNAAHTRSTNAIVTLGL